MDFVHDQLFDGKKIRALTIVETLSGVSPAVDVRQSYCGSDVVATFDFSRPGKPTDNAFIVSFNGKSGPSA